MKFSVDAAKAAAKAAVNHSSLDLKSGACLVSVEVQGACGERTLADSKSLIDGEVLDSKLLSGTKLRWFPKSALTFANTTSAKVRRTLGQYGVALTKGTTMVPISQLGNLATDIEHIEREFNKELNALRSNYDKLVEEHVAENREIEPYIRRCVEGVDQFAGRFIFKLNPPMAIQPLFDEDEEAMAKVAADNLLDEVAAEADAIYSRSLSGAEKATFKKMRPIIALKDKLINLSFIDPSIARVALAFDEMFSKLPKTYPIEGGDFQMVAHFIATASDPKKLRTFGSATTAQDDSDDAEVAVTAAPSDPASTDVDVPVEAPQVAEQNTTTEESDEQTAPAEVDLDQPAEVQVAPAPVSAEPATGAFEFDGW